MQHQKLWGWWINQEKFVELGVHSLHIILISFMLSLIFVFQIINAYMHLLSKSSTKKVFIYSTFFYSTLTKRNKGYDSVKRWTDQVSNKYVLKKSLFTVSWHMTFTQKGVLEHKLGHNGFEFKLSICLIYSK